MQIVPFRKWSRFGNELHLTAAISSARLLPGHYEWGAILSLMMRRCASDWVDGSLFRRPEITTQTSSIRAIANSLQKPYATVHRFVAGLIAEGWLTNVVGRIALSAEPRTAALIVAQLELAHDSFVRLAEDMAPDARFSRPAVAPAVNLHERTLMAALDAWLIPFEYASEPVSDWTSKLVYIIVVAANVRHVTANPLLSAEYSVKATPDPMRRPIPARQITSLSGLWYGTVFRHCKALQAQGLLRYERGGWLLSESRLSDAEVDQGVHALLQYFHKRISELITVGFDPSNAARHYLRGRPAYVQLDT